MRRGSEYAFKYRIVNVFWFVYLYMALGKSTWINKLINCLFVLKYHDSYVVQLYSYFFLINSKRADELKLMCS